MLIKAGANLKMYAKESINNPLHWACYFGDIQTTRLLVQKIPGLSIILFIYISAVKKRSRLFSY